MKAYGVFEGGGARGYAHVGALRAVEKRGIEFVAVAGTSIGAVIAALVAAGYTAAELFSEGEGTGPERGLLAEDLELQLLHKAEYRRIRRLSAPTRWMRAGGEWLRRFPYAKALADAIAAPFRRVFSRLSRNVYAMWWLVVVPSVALSPLIFLLHGRLFRGVWSQSGATGTELFREWLDEQLRRKLGKSETVRFGEMPIKLRVVAADLSEGAIRVFGGEEHRQMEVAEAVAASISYPLFFRPARIGDSILVDGGMVSNFPAWVLDDVRDEQERSYPTFGFRLLDPPRETPEEAWPGAAPPIVIALARRLLSTALNSRQSLESRRIDDYHPVTLTTHVRTLEFHRLNKERGQLVNRGQDGVERYFRDHIGPRAPEEMEVALRAYANLALEVLQGTGIVRAYLIQRVEAQLCRVVYSALMEADADDALLFRWQTNSQALCLQLREPVLLRVKDLPPQDLVKPATKYLHAVRRASVRHVYCIPIFRDPAEWSNPDPMARGEPIAALCIDFSDPDTDDLLLLDPTMEDWMTAIAQTAGEFWLDRVLTGVPEIPDPPPSPSPDWQPINGAAGYFVSHRKVRGPLTEQGIQKLDDVVRAIQKRSVGRSGGR